MKTKIIHNYLKEVHTEYFIAVFLIFYKNKAIQSNISIKDAEVKYEFSTNFTDSHSESSLRDMQKRIKNPMLHSYHHLCVNPRLSPTHCSQCLLLSDLENEPLRLVGTVLISIKECFHTHLVREGDNLSGGKSLILQSFCWKREEFLS